MNARQEANRKILARLGALNEAHGDQRFGQLLVNAGVTHDVSANTQEFQAPVNLVSYNEESTTILERVQKACERLFYGKG